jgi:peptidoglycan lytic transglycosylase
MGSAELMRAGKGAAESGRAYACALVAICALLAGCSGTNQLGRLDPRYGVSSSARVIPPGEPIPKGGGTYRVGQPYTVAGRTYVPSENPHYRAEGVASWYGEDFHGRLTANGEIFDMNSLSAAHTTLPLPSYVRVTNISNERSIIVRVNDRGPYHSDRVIDVSVRAAQLLGFYGSGLAPVRVEYVGTAPLEGSDDMMLAATLRNGGPAPAPPTVRIASAKPFVPELPSRPGIAHNVPIPEDRPYSLGEGQIASNYRPGMGTNVARTAPPDRPIAFDGQSSLRGTASAFAPPPPDFPRGDTVAPSLGMRGLY